MTLKRVVFVMALLLSIGAATNTVAQPTLKTNVVAVVHYTNPEQYRVFSIAPGQPQGTSLFILEGFMRTTFSPDGRLAAKYLPFRLDAPAPLLISLKGDPSPIASITAIVAAQPAKGERLMYVAFSSDGGTMFYTLASSETSQWRLGMLDLASDKQVDLTGKLDSAGQAATGFAGIAGALDLSADGKRLHFFSFPPFVAGGIGGIYSIDLSSLDRSTSIKTAFPKASELFKPDKEPIFSLIKRSPDGKQVAYLGKDASNPPLNYRREAPDLTANTLSVLDLTSGTNRVIARAPKGQGFQAFTWTSDNKSILVVGGAYEQTYSVISPRLLMVDVATAKISAEPLLPTEAGISVYDVQACEDTLFFTTVANVPYEPGDTIKPKLYSLPLSNFKMRSRVLVTSDSVIELKGCTAP